MVGRLQRPIRPDVAERREASGAVAHQAPAEPAPVRERASRPVGELLLVALDHLLDGLHVALGELLATGPRSLLAVERRAGVALELGEDTLRDQLEAALGGLRVGPLVREAHVAAEATGLLLQALDLLAGHVGGADRTESGVVD